MNKIKEFFAKRTIGIYILAFAELCLLIAFITAIVAGVGYGDLTAGIVILYIVGILVLASVAVKDFFGIGIFVGCVTTLIGYLLLLIPRLNMIGLIFNNVVDVALWPSLIACTVFTLLGVIAACVVAFIGVKKKEPAAPTVEPEEATPAE